MGRFHRHDDGVVHDHDDGVVHDHDDGVVHDHDAVDHSGYETGPERIEILERIFGENDRTAALNRADFAAHGVCAINVMSSPGAGKTTLLRETLVAMAAYTRIGILEGDIHTSLDADRLGGLGAAIALVNTGDGFGGECHLDAPMVRSGLAQLSLADLDLLLIENVGNLVCPAEFDVGEHSRVMVYSVTEGEDKPLKYPLMFRSVELVVINKMDLLPYLDCDLNAFRAHLRSVNPGVRTLEVSARTGEGVEAWCDWLREHVRLASQARAACA